MNHNNFFNGTFDFGPYDTTMDSSFYPRNKYRNDFAKLHAEDNFDEDFMLSPSSGSNMNFYNTGTATKFKRRVMPRAINFDSKRGSNVKASHTKNFQNEDYLSTSRAPNIHKNVKNNSMGRANKGDKVSKLNKGKGRSTSRNNAVNQSYNIPSLKQKLNMNDSDFSLGTSRNLQEGGGTHRTIERSGKSTRRLFMNPRSDANEMIYRLQRQVNELKAMLADSQAECDWVKRTIKFTEISEIKKENQTLYDECKRLKRFVNLLTDRESDEEISSELDNQIDEQLENNTLSPQVSSKLKSKKETIEKLLQENDRVNKLLEETQMENEGLKERILGGDISHRKKTTIISPMDIKPTKKKVLKNIDSKIVRQKTGYNAKAKQILNDTKKIDREIEKVKSELTKFSDDKVEHEGSNSSYITHKNDNDYSSRIGADPKEDKNLNEIAIVKVNEIADYISDLRLLMQVFEDRASKFLFKDKYLVSVNLAKDVFQIKLQMNSEAAHKLARFLIEPRDKNHCLNKNYTSNSSDIMNRIDELLGKYRRYGTDEVEKLYESIFSQENSSKLNRLINELEDLSHVNYLTKNEVERTISEINLNINIKTFMIVLMRDSNSLQNISGDALKNMLDVIRHEQLSKSGKSLQSRINNPSAMRQFMDKEKMKSTDLKTFEKSSSIKISQLKSPKKNSKTLTGRMDKDQKATPEDLKLNHNFFVRLAEFMFNNDLTLYQIIHKKIYDKMFNGREYELINSHTFFKLLGKYGYKFTEEEKRAVSKLLKTSYFIDVIEVEKISRILSELYIKEDIPVATKNFDYKHLSAPDIRMINRIVEYMDKNNIKEIEDFIGRDKITKHEVIGNNKREDVEIIQSNQFLEILLEKNLIEDDELNEGLQMFLAISMDDIDELMIRKLKKCVKDFKTVKYFQYFGTKFREEELVLSDGEEDDESVTVEEAFRSNMANKTNVVNHKGKRNPNAKN